MRRLATFLLLAHLAAGCSGDNASTVSSSPAPTAVAPAAKPVAKPATLANAQVVVLALKRAGLPLQVTIVFNESNDPNNLLGRPNGYASKTAFSDSRVKREPGDELGSVDLGGSVEFFTDRAGAERRKEYITSIQQKGGPIFGNEYEYLNGAALLRLSGRLTPTQAAGYEKAFAALLLKT